MKRLTAAALIATFTSHAPLASAQSHLVSPHLVASRLKEVSQHRSRDLATVLRVLSHSEVREALASLRVDPGDVGHRVSTLSDEELHDRADRVARLDVDPSAGGVGKGLLIAFAIIGMAFTLMLIVCSASDCN